MNPTSEGTNETPDSEPSLSLNQNSTGSASADQEALQAIGVLESEDNPSIEPEASRTLPTPTTPFQDVAAQPNPVIPAAPAPIDTTVPSYAPKPSEGPIISGPAKSSKLTIIILILLIILIAGGTIAYLKYTKAF